MPAVERGFYAIDTVTLLALDKSRLMEIARWGLETSAILVTKPSTVIASLSGRLTQIVLGVGSLIAAEKPPIEEYITIERKTWIDGCTLQGKPDYIMLDKGYTDKVELGGIINAVDIEDPAALFMNGLRVESTALAIIERPGEIVPLAVLGSYPVLSLFKGKYAIHVIEGPVKYLLEYIVSLASACS